MNKTTAVLDYMQTHTGITSMDAIELFGATRLSAIIFNLRKKYDIVGVDRECIDRFGHKATFTEYRLVK